MDFGKIVGELLQQGMSGATRDRVGHALGKDGLGGQSGIEDLLGGLLGGGGQAGAQQGSGGGGLGGLLEGLTSMLGGSSGVGGMSKGQVGGIGALAGALLGGGGGAAKGAIGGSAMALLGTLAISALKNWQQGSSQSASGDQASFAISEAEARQMSAPETAELCLKAMISAAKADGKIQQAEMDRIVGKLKEGGISEEEREIVVREMSSPLDVDGLVRAVPNQQVGAQVYAASLMAIKVDTVAEQTYLERLANGLGLHRSTVQRLHQMIGV